MWIDDTFAAWRTAVKKGTPHINISMINSKTPWRVKTRPSTDIFDANGSGRVGSGRDSLTRSHPREAVPPVKRRRKVWAKKLLQQYLYRIPGTWLNSMRQDKETCDKCAAVWYVHSFTCTVMRHTQSRMLILISLIRRMCLRLTNNFGRGKTYNNYEYWDRRKLAQGPLIHEKK